MRAQSELPVEIQILHNGYTKAHVHVIIMAPTVGCGLKVTCAFSLVPTPISFSIQLILPSKFNSLFSSHKAQGFLKVSNTFELER